MERNSNKDREYKEYSKITKAMEMVSASKMRKVQDRMKLGKPYSQQNSLRHRSHSKLNPEYKHPYFDTRDVKRVGYIVVSTDRGLCGGLNINAFKATVASMKKWSDQGVEIDICTIGARAATFFNNYGGNVVGAVRDIGDAPEVADLIGAVKIMLDKFDGGK